MSAQSPTWHPYAVHTLTTPARRLVAALAVAVILAIVGILAVAALAAAAPACTRTWDGGGATTAWDDPANWDGAGDGELPVATDHVCIPGGFSADHGTGSTSILSLQSEGTLTLSDGTLSLTDTANGSTVTTFVQSGGILGGAATLTVLDAFDWTGGEQTDAGRTVIDDGASVTIDGESGVNLRRGRVFENRGAVTWVRGTIFLWGAAPGLRTTILNAGTFEAQDDSLIGQTFGNVGEVELPLFDNDGTFLKSGDSGTTVFGVPTDNDGTFDALSGTIRLTHTGDGSSTGTFATASGSLVQFVDDHTLGSGAAFDGNIELENGTLTLAADINVPLDATFTQSGGILAGTGTLTVLGTLQWTSGEQTDAGRTVIDDGANATIDSQSSVNLRRGRVFENRGTTTWVRGTILVWGAAPGLRTTILNDGTFEAQDDSTIGQTFGNIGELEVPLFHNRGSFLKSGGTDATVVGLPFDNDGTTESEVATIRFTIGGDGTATGTFTTSPDALIEFRNGTFELGAGAVLAGDVLLSFAILDVSADVSAAVGTFTQVGGILTGSGTLTVLGDLEWTEGEQTGVGRTLIAEDATATLGGPGAVMALRGGRTLENHGAMTWSGGSIVVWRAQTQTTIENAGSFQATADGFLDTTGGISDIVEPVFHNVGTFTKTGGTGETRLLVPFLNDGTVAVESGTLAINGTFANYVGASRTLVGGEWIVTTTLEFNGADIDTLESTVTLAAPAATIVDEQGANGLRRIASVGALGSLTLSGGADLLTAVPFTNEGIVSIGADSAFASTGAFEQADGTTTLQATTSSITATASEVRVTGGELLGIGSIGPAVVVSGGELSPGLSPGTINASGTYQQASGGTLHVEIGGTTPGTEFDVLAVTGAAQIGGTLFIETLPGFTPSPGDTFRILTTSTRTGEFVSLLGTELGNGMAYTAQYNPTDVTLVVTALSLSIDNVTVAEGDAGSTTATFTVTLSEPAADVVTVDFATGDGTAVEPDDFAAAGGTLTFQPGETTKTVDVQVAGDTLDEDDETFVVDLSNATNAPLAKSQGIGTITDNDPLSTVSIEATDATVTEGNLGDVDATFTVTLTPATGRTVTVGFATAPGTATSPADFAAKTGTLTFGPGETSKPIVVSVHGDTTTEPDETFFVDLSSPVKAQLGTTTRATGTILDDDAATISVGSVSVDEGNSGTVDATFPVTLSAASTEAVTVDYATADVSAVAPDDYLPTSGTITWAPGETSKSVVVKVVGDTLPESTETFDLNLTNAVKAAILDGSGTGTIADDGDIAGTPDFDLRITPPRQVLVPGGTVKFAIQIIPVFGFDEPVTLSTLDLPPEITQSFSVNPVDPPGTSILTLTAPPGFPVGEQGFRVRGVGGGITQVRSANTTLDFGLVPICAGSVEGFVTDEETGAPIEDAIISINPEIKTDASGFYRIEDIQLDEHNNPIEDFAVRAIKDGYWDDLERGIVICDGVTRIDLELLRWRPASVSGTIVEGTPDATDPTVIHPTTTPIPSAELLVRGYGFDQSDATGEFAIAMEKLNPRNQPLVDAQLEVQAAGYWSRPSETIGGLLSSPYPLGTIDPDEHITDLIVPLVKKCTGTVTGVVTDAVTGAAIPNARVTVAWPIAELDVRTDATGRYTYPGVLLGHNNTRIDRSVGISAAGYSGDVKTFLMRSCGETQTVDFALALAPPPIFGTLEGHVYDAETNQPIVGARVFTPVCATPPGTTCTATDANGFYRLQNVPLPTADRPVEVTFFAEHPPGYYSTFETFLMSANTTTEHDFRLVPSKHARLTGIVRDRFTGLPIAGASGFHPSLPSAVTTDANGRYQTGPIQLPSPGDPTSLTLRFEAAGYWGQTKSKAVSASETPFELDFDLLPICEDATIQGTVVNAVTQAPIVGASVTGGGQSTTTAQNGTYKLEHLRVGTDNSPIDVTIRVTAPRFHPQEKTVKVFCNATLIIDFGRPPELGTIIVRKTTDPADSTQAFTFTPTWTTTGFDLAGGATKTFSNLAPGSGYSISETVPEHWQQHSATCDDGSPITNIDLAPGETVTCTFVNRKLATLIVRKQTQPSPDQTATSFPFTAGGGLSPTTFSLADGASRTFSDLDPKAGYSLAETPPAGWQAPTATCDDGSPITNIDLAAGETVTCTFVNRKAATLTIRKATVPSPDPSATSFGFTTGGGLTPTTFSLADGGSRTFADLEPKSGYSVAEDPLAEWLTPTATCDDGSPVTNIDLAAGENVTCTFVNRPRPVGTIIVAKTTDPVGSDVGFPFTPSWAAGFTLKHGETKTFANLDPGAGYNVAETGPAGWQQQSATCDDGSPVTSIDLAAGETVTCTFVNRKLATLIVRKQTQPSPDQTATQFPFTAGGGLSPSTFNLADGGSRTFSNLEPASGYSLAETPPAGWQQHSATCDDGSPVTNIDLAAGETVTCTFVNRKLATLIVRKQTQPSPDQTATSFPFTAGGGLSPTTFSLADGASRTFSDLDPKAGYSLAEQPPAGWQRQAATCSDGSPVTNVNLAPGETVTCTFVNRRVPLATGAHTIGFWRNNNGQKIIKGGAVVGGACASGTWLRQFAPFQDLPARSTCAQVASWVTSVINAASSSGSSMNPMLKAQMLATALSVFFSDPALGGNKIGAPAPIGQVRIDLKTVCIVATNGSCSGKVEDVSPAFGGAASLKVIDALIYAGNQSNVGGSVWYGQNKAIQTLAKDLFDAINNNQAFAPP